MINRPIYIKVWKQGRDKKTQVHVYRLSYICRRMHFIEVHIYHIFPIDTQSNFSIRSLREELCNMVQGHIRIGST